MHKHSNLITLGVVGLLCLCRFSYASGLELDSRKLSKITTKGDLETFSTVRLRLPVGTNGQILSVDSSTAEGIKWANPPAGGSGSSPLTTKGDIFAFSTINDRFPIGSMGQMLSVDTGSTFGIKWVPSPSGSASPGSPVNSVQFNSASNFGGDGSFSWNSDVNRLGISRDSGQIGMAIVISSESGTTLANISHDGGATFNSLTLRNRLSEDSGGTGQSTYVKGDILGGTGTNTIGKLAIGSMGQLLSVDTAATQGFKWVTGITTPDVNAGVFPVARGGTGFSSFTKGDLLAGVTTNNSLNKLPVGSMGQILSVDTGSTTGLAWVAAPSGSGSPGSPSGSIQYNNAGSFAGASLISTDGTMLRIGPGTTTNVSLDVAGNFRSVPFTLTDGANISIDPTRSNTFFVTLGGNRTLMNPNANQFVPFQKLILVVSQDGTGTRKLGFDTAYKFGLDVATYDASTTPTGVDYIGFIVRNAQSIDCVAVSRSYR